MSEQLVSDPTKIFVATYRFGHDRRALEAATMAHMDHLNDLGEQGSLLCSGPMGDPMFGALLVLRADDLATAQLLVAGDPYCAGDLVTDVRVDPWIPMLGRHSDVFGTTR